MRKSLWVWLSGVACGEGTFDREEARVAPPVEVVSLADLADRGIKLSDLDMGESRQLDDDENTTTSTTVDDCQLMFEILHLHDNTESMKHHLDNMHGEVEDLVEDIVDDWEGSRYALASFSDKPLPDFGHATRDYCFRLEQPLTSDEDAIEDAAKSLEHARGKDEPDGALEAMMHGALNDAVGWSGSSRPNGKRLVKVLMVTSSSTMHVAGDGGEELGLPANDGDENLKCTEEDYPSFVQVRGVLNSLDFNVIFLTKKDADNPSIDLRAYYEYVLAELAVEGVVRELSEESKDFRDDGYNALKALETKICAAGPPVEPTQNPRTTEEPIETTTEAPEPIESTTAEPEPIESTTEEPEPIESTTEAPEPIESTTQEPIVSTSPAPPPTSTNPTTTTTQPSTTSGGSVDPDCDYVVVAPGGDLSVDNAACKIACKNKDFDFFKAHCMEEDYGLDANGNVETPGSCFEQWGHGYVDAAGTEELAGIEMWTKDVKFASDCQQLCQDHPDCAAFLYRVVSGGAEDDAGNCVLKSAEQIREAVAIEFDGTLWNTTPADDPMWDWCNVMLDYECTTPGRYECLTCPIDATVCAYHSVQHVSGPKRCGQVWECGVLPPTTEEVTTTARPTTTTTTPHECSDTINLELALLMDGSHSFDDDKPALQIQFPQLMRDLTEHLGGRTQFAFGSFVDKPIEPFGWPSDYCLKLDTPLTTDQGLIEDALGDIFPAGGYDWWEGSLDALVDFVWNPEMGWSTEPYDGEGRANLRMVTLATDAGYHKAGDAPDLAERTLGPLNCTGEDYASPAMLGDLLLEKNIIPIFMTTDHATSFWEGLRDELAEMGALSYVCFLEDDSSNIYDLITEVIIDICTDPTALPPSEDTTSP